MDYNVIEKEADLPYNFEGLISSLRCPPLPTRPTQVRTIASMEEGPVSTQSHVRSPTARRIDAGSSGPRSNGRTSAIRLYKWHRSTQRPSPPASQRQHCWCTEAHNGKRVEREVSAAQHEHHASRRAQPGENQVRHCFAS